MSHNTNAASRAHRVLFTTVKTRATGDTIKLLGRETWNSMRIILADIVTASGSGLDPDVSVEAALLQVNRVVKARQAPGGKNAHITVARVKALIAQHTQGRDPGVLGSRVSMCSNSTWLLTRLLARRLPDTNWCIQEMRG